MGTSRYFLAKTRYYVYILRRDAQKQKTPTYCAIKGIITLFITVKAIAKLNLEHRNKFEIEFYKISRRSSRSSDNAELVISRRCLAEGGKEMYKKLL